MLSNLSIDMLLSNLSFEIVFYAGIYRNFEILHECIKTVNTIVHELKCADRQEAAKFDAANFRLNLNKYKFTKPQ